MDEIESVLAQWISAETSGDAVALDRLLGSEFRGDGPLGFVLSKEEWLDRYRTGALAIDVFAWQDTEIRLYDDTAVVMGLQAQHGTYEGHDCSGEFRGTLVAVRRAERWEIVNVQLSPATDGHALTAG